MEETMNKLFLTGAVVLALFGVNAAGYAENYPSRPIMMIVPFPAGGPSDTVARITADGMSRNLGQSIIIENVGGAGGTLGASRAAAADPDGYTIMAVSMGAHVSAPVFYPNLRYDPRTDFEPIGLTANAPAAIAVKKELPVNNLKEFIAYVKAHGADVKQAHGGIGATSHMACLLFNKLFDLHPTLVAYRGTGPAVNDLIGGHVDYYCEQAVSVAPGVKGGLIKGLVVSGNERLAALPDVPTAKEAGAPDFQLNVWSGVFAPKGTPKDVIAKLNDALNKTLEEPGTAEKLSKLGGTVPAKDERGPEHLRKLVHDDMDRWAPILKAAAAENKPN
jgi:tripartite-type tricarboxylate transporter receptor subunit TctC